MTVWFSWLSYAVKEFNYESAKSLASDSIENSSFDENWKDWNPHILWEWKYFYTDSTSPSYIEFKVSCDKTPDCWFVMVNYDWDDVSVPIASTSWNTPSEVLLAQNWWDVNSNKLYYFSPFEQYSEDEKTWEVSSIEQDDNIDNKLAQDKNLNADWKAKKRKEFQSELKNKLSKAKNEAKDYKKSDDFKTKRKDLKDKKQTIPKDEYSYKILPLANATLTGYIPPTASNIIISWSEYWTCKWKLPCYSQFNTTYNWVICAVWCVPSAYWMIYWYYDRNGTYPNLIAWTASTTNDSTTNTMLKSLWTYLLTTCSWSEWLTSSTNLIKWIQYAKDKWYANSSALKVTWTVSNLFSAIKSSIDLNRPIMANTTTHAMVAYWYNSASWNPIIRLNLWWWQTMYQYWTDWITKYYYSSIDFNMNWLYYDNADKWRITSLVRVTISN